MKPIVRMLLGIALVIVGILTAAFFGLLLLMGRLGGRASVESRSRA